jgi:hypothetical protein
MRKFLIEMSEEKDITIRQDIFSEIQSHAFYLGYIWGSDKILNLSQNDLKEPHDESEWDNPTMYFILTEDGKIYREDVEISHMKIYDKYSRISYNDFLKITKEDLLESNNVKFTDSMNPQLKELFNEIFPTQETTDLKLYQDRVWEMLKEIVQHRLPQIHQNYIVEATFVKNHVNLAYKYVDEFLCYKK